MSGDNETLRKWTPMLEWGYVKLYRKLLKSDMYANLTSVQRDVMIVCLMLANHAPKSWEWNGQVYKCEPGQFITSITSLKKLCGKNVSEKMVRTSIVKLAKWGFLVNQGGTTGSLITIMNWYTYQVGKEEEGMPKGKQGANEGQTKGKRRATNKNGKKDKKDKNKYSPTSQEARLAGYLLEKILKRNPDHKRPDLDVWAGAVDRMIRLDKRSPESIRDVIDWCQKDSFWQSNILSTEKLRAQFDQLVIKMKAAGGQSKPSTPPKEPCKDCGTTKWTAFTAGRCEDCYQKNLQQY